MHLEQSQVHLIRFLRMNLSKCWWHIACKRTHRMGEQYRVEQEANADGVFTKLRVSLDPRDLNKWVKQEHLYTKEEEVVAQLNDAKFFSIIDAKKGYWHVPLDKQSSLLTTTYFTAPLASIALRDSPLV